MDHYMTLRDSATVVIPESFYNNPHGPPAQMTPSQREADAREMAAAIGPRAQVISGKEALKCSMSDCWAAGHRSVVEVTEPSPPDEAGEQRILVRVLSPAGDLPSAPRGIMTFVQIVVRKTPAGWNAVSGPSAATIVPVRKG
jgi:hypothetical protein